MLGILEKWPESRANASVLRTPFPLASAAVEPPQLIAGKPGITGVSQPWMATGIATTRCKKGKGPSHFRS
jgi:hypothetical protein